MTNSTNALPDTKTELEIQKLAGEIVNLRRQRGTFVVTTILAVVSLLVSNLDQMERLLRRNGRMRILIADPIAATHGTLTVYSLAASTPRVVFTDKASKVTRPVELSPGPYRIEVSDGAETPLLSNVQLVAGQERTIELDRVHGGIAVRVAPHIERSTPGQALPVEVTASGNGYLWIFERVGGKNVLLYPTDQVQSNAVMAGIPFTFSDKEPLKAGEKPGIEHLLFIVTSSNRTEGAQDCVNRIAPAKGIAKAAVGAIQESWGYASLRYVVGDQ
jgi:hypothetical protein